MMGSFIPLMKALIISNGFQFWRYIHESEDFGDLGLNGTLRVLPAFFETFRDFAKRKR